MYTFPDGCKFAVLALTNALVDIPDDDVSLPGFIQALTHLPIEFDQQWQSWLGTQFSEIREANLVFVARSEAQSEGLLTLDSDSSKLAKTVEDLFTMLRLVGTIEYEHAFLVMGCVQNGRVICKQFGRFPRYEITRGCLPWMIREEHLCSAAELLRAKSLLLSQFVDAQKVRIFRGFWALTSGLQHWYASDRIHGFVRALEAVICPETGRTKKQFIHRCSLFAAPSTRNDIAKDALKEAYQMRCDIEHLHEWDRSLTKYAQDQREDVAFWRARQMEALACAIYVRIFGNVILQQHFSTDNATHEFWRKTETEIRAAVGCVCDITELKNVQKYDQGVGRAQYSEWPAGWKETLERKHPQNKKQPRPPSGSDFPAVRSTS